MAGCEIFGTPMPFRVVNRSSNKIYFYISNKYPDTSLPLTNKNVFSIKPNSGYFFEDPRRKPYPNLYSNNDMLIFFFNADTIEHYNWDVIRNDNKILERRMFSQEDIRKNRGIFYP